MGYRRRNRKAKRLDLLAGLPWQANLVLAAGAGAVAYFHADVAQQLGSWFIKATSPSTLLLQLTTSIEPAVSQALRFGGWAVCAGAGLFVGLTALKNGAAKLKEGRNMRAALSAAARSQSLKEISWREFEYLVGRFFKDKGYKVEIGEGTQDGGVDIIARSSSGKKLLIQCKHWRSTDVGAPVVREMVGVVQLRGADAGAIVCSDRFTRNAHAEAEKLGIKLIGGAQLAEYVAGRRSRSAGFSEV